MIRAKIRCTNRLPHIKDIVFNQWYINRLADNKKYLYYTHIRENKIYAVFAEGARSDGVRGGYYYLSGEQVLITDGDYILTNEKVQT